VIAVVSALAGETERLLAHAATFDEAPDPYSLAALASLGELRSAALLGLALGRADVPHCVLDAGAIALRASGDDPLDAEPIGVDAGALGRALDEAPVVVLPGYVARDDAGRAVLLGRGGSDLSALFVTAALPGARCRLIKDVAGLYERDPALPGPPPRRFSRLPWSRACGFDGAILQHKAARFARAHSVCFEVGALADDRVTLVGASDVAFDALASAPPLGRR